MAGGGGGGSWTGYSNLEIDTSLNSKANQATTYTKTEVDTSLGSKANSEIVYTQSQIDTSLGLKANLANPVFTANVPVASVLDALAVDTTGLTANAVNTNQYYSSNLTADTTWSHNATEYMRYDYTNSTLKMKQELQVENGFKTDTLDSLTNTNLVFSRNGDEYMRFQVTPSERIKMNMMIMPMGGRGKSEIYEAVEGNFNVLRVRNFDTTAPSIILSCIGATETSTLNLITSGLTITPELDCNIYNSNGDNDVSFRRNGFEYSKLDDANKIVNVAGTIGVSTGDLYANDIRNRSLATDTVYYGAHSDGVSPQVEYMRYDHANSVLNIVSGIAFSGGLNSDIVNTANNTAMSIQRNSVDYIRLTTDDRVKIDKQMDIESDGVGLNISDSIDGNIGLGNGNQIDSFFVGGGAREMYLNYVSDTGVRIGNTAGYLAVNGARNGTDTLTVNGSSYFNGHITCTGNIEIDNQDRITFGDRHYVREENDRAGKRLKFYGSNSADSFRFVVGLETIESARVMDISQNNVLVRGNIEAHKSWGNVKSNAFDTYDNDNCILKRNAEEFMRFDTDGSIKASKHLYFTGGDGASRIYEAIDNTSSILRIWNDSTINIPITILGAGADANILLVYPDLIEARKPMRCNSYNTNGNFHMLLQQNGSTFAFYDKEYVNYPSGIYKFDCDVSVNVINFFQCQALRAHIFDSHDTLEPDDISFRYNGTNYMFYDNSASQFKFVAETIMLNDLNVAGIVKTNTFDSYTANDINFRYNGTIYMYYDLSTDQVRINTDMFVTDSITCTVLTETSDKRLKENIEDVEPECSDLVKKIKVRKYYMKNDSKKKHNIGFIADEIEEVIPPDMENIVRNDNEFKSVNYGRMSAILWKTVQQQMERIDKLESEVAELKGCEHSEAREARSS